MTSPIGGSAGMRNTAHSVESRQIVSIAYIHENPSTGMSAPASSGPAMPPAIATVMSSEFAAGSNSGSSRRGSDDCNAG